MTNRQFQSQKSYGIRFAYLRVNDGSRTDGKSEDNLHHRK